MRKFLLLNIIFLATLFSAQVTFAHAYHYEVQVTNALQTNDKKQLEALKLTFLYDGETSGVMLQDQKNLGKLGKKLASDLGKLAYFTQAKVNGKVLDFKEASDIKLNTIKEEGDDKKTYDVLQLHFTLALKTPVKIDNNSEINFFHEDPSDAAILYYENEKHILLGDNLKEQCKASVKEKEKFDEGEFPQIVSVSCKT
ncbi:MAG: DUF1007 family protein [Cocleimonas sp.]|nr:DUF1007 family protein [Cocleimonas sp.]